MKPGFERQVKDTADKIITSEITYGETEAQTGAVFVCGHTGVKNPLQDPEC